MILDYRKVSYYNPLCLLLSDRDWIKMDDWEIDDILCDTIYSGVYEIHEVIDIKYDNGEIVLISESGIHLGREASTGMVRLGWKAKYKGKLVTTQSEN